MPINADYRGPSDLPEVIPVFPLPGALLLPRGQMPLNIFEQRYLAMVDDALRDGHRLIGMIQPDVAHSHNEEKPELFRVGCVGRITQLAESGDGRYILELTGIARYEVVEELEVLTPYRPAAGAANLAAEYVYSRMTYKATVIGVDPAAGLALLQMEGSNGRAFSTVTVGNSDTIGSSAAAVREASYHVPGEVIDSAVSTTGTADGVSLDVGTLSTLNTTVDIDGTTWTWLMASTLPSPLPWVLGDPLVNLNGHVIGIIVGNARSGSSTVAYAIPINPALAVATQIADGNS